MSTEYDTRTYFDKAGVERWVDDDTVIDQNGPFRKGPSGIALEVAKMAQAHHNSVATSRAVSRDAAAGRGRGTIQGISRKADANMVKGIPDVYAPARLEPIAERQTQAYGKALGNPVPNFASMKRKGMPQR